MLLKSPLLRKRTLSFFLSIEFGQSADRLSKKERTDERKHHIILADCPLSTNERVGVSANIDKSLRYYKLLDMDSAYRYIPLFLGGTKIRNSIHCRTCEEMFQLVVRKKINVQIISSYDSCVNANKVNTVFRTGFN
jgi:hypothetical protein